MLIISSDPNCQGFKIQSHGGVQRKEAVKSGLWLLAEEWVESEDCPLSDGYGSRSENCL